MSNNIPDVVHDLLRSVVPEIEDILNDYLQTELQQDSTISKQYVYNRALRVIMHNFESSFGQNEEDIINHVVAYSKKRLDQLYYDAYEYKHRAQDRGRVQEVENVLHQQPYQIMYERPMMQSSQREINIRPFAIDHWFSSD